MQNLTWKTLICCVFVCAPIARAETVQKETPSGTTFERLYTSDSSIVGNSVKQLPDGGYVQAGYSQSVATGDEDVLLIRTDSMGAELWRKTYGGPLEDDGWEIQVTSDGGFIVTGFTASFGAGGSDVWLMRFDANGDTLWTRTFGGAKDEFGWSICVLEDGGYLIAAQTESFGSGERDAWVLRTDSAGDTLWTDVFGGTETDRIFSVSQMTDGSIVVTGLTNSEGHGDMDVLVMRYALSGKRLWKNTFGSSALDIGHGVTATRDGGLVVAGYTAGTGAGGQDLMLLRLDRDGDSLWSTVVGRERDDRGMIARELPDGGFIATGYSRAIMSGRWDGYLVRTDSAGNVLWSRFPGTPYDENFNSVIQTADRGLALIGRSWSMGTRNPDVWLVKTDSLGRYTRREGD